MLAIDELLMHYRCISPRRMRSSSLRAVKPCVGLSFVMPLLLSRRSRFLGHQMLALSPCYSPPRRMRSPYAL